jgi:hypothetical protein
METSSWFEEAVWDEFHLLSEIKLKWDLQADCKLTDQRLFTPFKADLSSVSGLQTHKPKAEVPLRLVIQTAPERLGTMHTDGPTHINTI